MGHELDRLGGLEALRGGGGYRGNQRQRSDDACYLHATSSNNFFR
jgi:hypothetical protein